METGFLYGVSNEIVYDGSRYLSELRWEMRPLWFAGLSAEYTYQNPRVSFFAELDIKTGLPAQTGAMEDRDWLKPAVPSGALTNFSSHENHTKTALLLDAAGGVSYPLGAFRLKTGLRFSYMYFKWEAWNGYTQYGTNNPYNSSFVEWKPSFKKEPFTGLGIDYLQHWLLLSPAITLECGLDRFSFAFSFAISPIIFCYSSDNHFKRNPPFTTYEFISGGMYAEPGAAFSFLLTPSVRIELAVSFRYIEGSRGNLYTDEYTPSGTERFDYGYAAGAGFGAFKGALAFTYSF